MFRPTVRWWEREKAKVGRTGIREREERGIHRSPHRRKPRVADLELTTCTHFIEKNIPFTAIHSLGKDVNQVAARIVTEATEVVK